MRLLERSSFSQLVVPVGEDVFKLLRLAVGPFHRQGFNGLGLAQTEVQAKVMSGLITAIAPHFSRICLPLSVSSVTRAPIALRLLRTPPSARVRQ